MVLEEMSPDLLAIVLPIVLGVLAVLVTVVVVFWIGSGTGRSYEEAKAQASRKAEEVLKEKEHLSPRAKKPRKNFRKKKSEEHQEETEPVPRKGILKVATPASGDPDRSLPHKVGFKLETPLKDGEKASRTNPPTPHPIKDKPLSSQAFMERTPQPLFEVEEPEEETPPVIHVPKEAEVPKKKPQVPVTNEPPTSIGSREKSGSTQKKSKVKSKQSPATVPAAQEVMPVSRITEILGASSLTDEEIEALIGLLLEKSNMNSEWEAAKFKAESNKSLKKMNHDLQIRLDEAQQTVLSYSTIIKDLRREIQTQKIRHQSSENALQAKLTHQANDLSIFKTRASGLEEEIKQLKELNDSQHFQKLNDENIRLATQVAHFKQQLSTMTNQMQEAMESNESLKNELSALKASGGGAGAMEKLAEKDHLLEQRKREIDQLEMTMQHSHAETMRLKSELQPLVTARDERDILKKKVNILEAEKGKLIADIQQASKEKDDTLAQMEALGESLEQAKMQDAAQIRAKLQAQHSFEIEELKKTMSDLEGVSVEVEGLKETISHLEGQNKKMATEIEKCSSLKREVASLSQQLEAEQARKKDLEKELEAATPNGPVQVEVEILSNGGSELITNEKPSDPVLEKKLEDIKLKYNQELSNSLWQVKDEAMAAEKLWENKLKEAQEMAEQRAKSARNEALVESYQSHRALLQQLFPEVSVEVCDGKYMEWLDEFETKAQHLLDSTKEENELLKERVDELEQHKEESAKELKHLRQTLEDIMDILKKLQEEVNTNNAEHQKALEEKEAALNRECSINKGLQDELQKEKEALARVEKELEASQEAGRPDEEEIARLEELEQRLQEVELNRNNMEQEVGNLQNELRQKEEAQQELEQRVGIECKLKENAMIESNKLLSELNQHKVELKSCLERLETMKQSNRELNVQLSAVAPSSPTDSEV